LLLPAPGAATPGDGSDEGPHVSATEGAVVPGPEVLQDDLSDALVFSSCALDKLKHRMEVCTDMQCAGSDMLAM
jgi:hypothetical protein